MYQIPLIEVIAESLSCGAGTKKASEIYMNIIMQTGRESAIWLGDEIPQLKNIPDTVAEGIKKIKNNSFDIVYGFDGKYGKIVL